MKFPSLSTEQNTNETPQLLICPLPDINTLMNSAHVLRVRPIIQYLYRCLVLIYRSDTCPSTGAGNVLFYGITMEWTETCPLWMETQVEGSVGQRSQRICVRYNVNSGKLSCSSSDRSATKQADKIRP